MFIDLHKALERLEEHLLGDRKITLEMLEKAYEQTLWLRSYIIGILYDMIDFGSASKRTIGEASASQTDNNRIVCLIIPVHARQYRNRFSTEVIQVVQIGFQINI